MFPAELMDRLANVIDDVVDCPVQGSWQDKAAALRQALDSRETKVAEFAGWLHHAYEDNE